MANGTASEKRECLLRVDNIRKAFGDQTVLQDVSLEVDKGDVIAILGPSGSGKTTLLRCLNFLETPDAGTITVQDKVLFDADHHANCSEKEIRKNRLHFGMVFQSFNLFPQYTALENVTLARALALHPDILCFDEPTSALDPELTGEVLKVIRGLAEQKTTMIIVTHEMAFARDVADQVIFMDGGFIVEQGDPKQVIDHPQEERTKQFLARFAENN